MKINQIVRLGRTLPAAAILVFATSSLSPGHAAIPLENQAKQVIEEAQQSGLPQNTVTPISIPPNIDQSPTGSLHPVSDAAGLQQTRDKKPGSITPGNHIVDPGIVEALPKQEIASNTGSNEKRSPEHDPNTGSNQDKGKSKISKQKGLHVYLMKLQYQAGEPVIFWLVNNTDRAVVMNNSAPWRIVNETNGETVYLPNAFMAITFLQPGQQKQWAWYPDDGRNLFVAWDEPIGSFRVEFGGLGLASRPFRVLFGNYQLVENGNIMLFTTKRYCTVGTPVTFGLQNLSHRTIHLPGPASWHIVDSAGNLVSTPPASTEVIMLSPGEKKLWTWAGTNSDNQIIDVGTYRVVFEPYNITLVFEISEFAITGPAFPPPHLLNPLSSYTDWAESYNNISVRA
ncbi:MAG: hypothetical protein BWY68_00574 [bacterium ADurb.Bin400]|nr:MAG: hypothetical protein BWY68_00574 [bacterium ADurb.Bin400]